MIQCKVDEDGIPCTSEGKVKGMCHKHYRRYLKWGTATPLNTKRLTPHPRCPKCSSEWRAIHGMTAAVNTMVARHRVCAMCGHQSLTLEVPVSKQSVTRMGETLLGRFYKQMPDDSDTPTRPEAADAESTGMTTAETSASSGIGR